jgi:hypothetical protein
LKVKELQAFESETILCLFNVFNATNKNTVLAELCEILSKAQDVAQDMDPTEFFWDLWISQKTAHCLSLNFA